MTLGQRIAFYRLNQGLSQEALAAKLSVSPQTISNWEFDLEEPSVTALIQLATALQVSLDNLLSKEIPVATPAPQAHRSSTATQPAKTATAPKTVKKPDAKRLRICLILVSAILLLGILGGLFAFMIFEPGAPLSGVRIQLDMTPEEVIAILGEPHDGKVKLNGSYIPYEKFLDYNRHAGITSIFDESITQKEIVEAEFYYYNGRLGRTLNRMTRLEKKAENISSTDEFLRLSKKYEKLEARCKTATYTHKLIIEFDKGGVCSVAFKAND